MKSQIPSQTIIGMTNLEIKQVVSIHLRSFRGFFLCELGPSFLRCLYEEICSDPSGIALVCKRGHEVLGFVVGTAEPHGFYRRLLFRRWHRFALASVLPLLRHPSILPRLLNAFTKVNDEPSGIGCGLLMSIGVDPRFQASGVGASLVRAFLAESRKRGLTSVHLTTDHLENDQANRFYSKLGFINLRVFSTPQGRLMNDYRIEIASKVPEFELASSHPSLAGR
jgi:ribosomal protein S18 acetylase RimI-like enzyme